MNINLLQFSPYKSIAELDNYEASLYFKFQLMRDDVCRLIRGFFLGSSCGGLKVSKNFKFRLKKRIN